MSVRIKGVTPGSLCYKKGLRAGDELISINGNEITDVLDYQFYITESVLQLVYRRDNPEGKFSFGQLFSHGEKEHTVRIKKQQYEDIGLEFESYLMDRQRSCTNNCIFCFVDQMPPNMRESLYFKDDDARLSFLFGNYITLTNLKESEIDRIIRMKISPINISVHTTNPELRCQMMNNRFAGEKLAFIKKLVDAGITVNCQLVMCPGINDGEELRRSLHDLGAFYPGVQSIACVPVGLTKYREGLYPLKGYDRESARRLIQDVASFADAFYAEHGTRLAYASDEFYLRAELPLPDEDFYEDFAQLENGVGVIANLKTDFYDLYEELEPDDRKRNLTIATGVDAAPFIRELIDEAKKKWHNLECTVYAIRNDFFGESITVAGLVTGQDIIAQLKGQPLGDVLLLPDCMLRHQQDKFLDDYTVEDVEKALDIRVKIVGTEGDSLLRGLLEE